MTFIRLSSNYFFYFALLGLSLPYLSIFLDGHGFTSRQIGEILAVITATKIIAPSLWAVLADKSKQPLLIIKLGAFLALVSFSALYWFTLYWPITLSLSLFTLFWTAILPQLEVHTLNSIKRSNKIYARIRLWGSIGFIVLAVMAGEVISRFGFLHFVNLGVFILLGLFISTLLLKANKTKGSLPTLKNESTPIINKLLNRNFICFFSASLLLQISFGPYYSFFALFLRDLGYSGLAIGLFISLGVLAEIVAFIYMGELFKRFSLKSLLVFSLLITALRWTLTPVVADSVLLLALIQLSHAASFAVYHSACMKFISSHFTKSQQGRAQGLYLGGVFGVGGAIGAYLSGLLWLEGEGATQTFYLAGLSALLGGLILLMNNINRSDSR